MKTTTECGYLEGGGPEGLGALRQVLLYHSQDSKGRAVWALHMPADSRSVYCQLKALLQELHGMRQDLGSSILSSEDLDSASFVYEGLRLKHAFV